MTRLRPVFLPAILAAMSMACSLTGTGPAAPTTAPVATEAARPGPATEVPTETASPTDAPAPTAEAYVGATACDHAYLPLRPGATWVYSGPNGKLVQTVTAVEGDASQASATLSSTIGDSPADTLTYVCTPDGIRRGDSVYGGMDTYKNTFKDGVEVPPAELLAPGYSWSYTLEEEAQGSVTELTRTSEVSGAQSVEVGGETFDALVIDYDQGGRTGQQIWARGVGVYSYGSASGFTLESFTPGAP